MEEVKKQGMKSLFCPYEQALQLKELGFDEPCIAFYLEKVLTFHTHGIDPHFIFKKNSNLWYSSSAPTYSQAFRWFREKYSLHSTITSISQESWQWHITKPGESLGKLYDEDFYTYEEAELDCLVKLIEILKEKL